MNCNLHIFAITIMLLSATTMAAKDPIKKNGGNNIPAREITIEPDAIPVKPAADIASKPAKRHHLTGSTLGAGHINTRYTEGIDVSHYQGSINWEQVCRSANISYVYIKATEGADLQDDCYRRNLEGARRMGLSVGSYHFYRPQIPWQKQLQNMMSVIKTADQDLVPIIDIEHAGRNEAMFIADLTEFIRQVTEYYGKKPLLYTYQNFYNKHFNGILTDYPWMIACYQNSPPVLNDGNTYVIWQYSSSGQIGGIPTRVDRSRLMFNQSLELLRL